ncbi:putative structural protein [Pseudomonas phage LKD16]|uniref:Putative structural protein n=1 Tax=Pseudomonas phage LKD16 TaxID=386792 RepID=Q0E622_9CAUD|nr:tail fiber protein [Pseudomonas phage LKD16]CAK25977.1 putative structural protein [Pseudomonas phage LKD16]
MALIYDFNEDLDPQAKSKFVGARARRDISDVLDFCDGGVAIQDPSEGLFVRVWRTMLRNDGTYLGWEDGTNEVRIGDGIDAGISTISLDFDSNMNYVFVFVRADKTGALSYFNVQQGRRIIVELGQVDYAKVALDDKRPGATAWAQVIVPYTRGGNMYVRTQNENYTQEHLEVDTGKVFRPLVKCGMGTNLRFQVQFRGHM